MLSQLINNILFDIIRDSFPHLSPQQQQVPFESFAEICHEGDSRWTLFRARLPEILANLAAMQAELWPQFAA